MRTSVQREWSIARKTVRSWQAFTVVMLFAAGNACADDLQKPWESTPPPNVIEDRAALEVALWNTSIDTIIRADATPQQPGTTLSAETELGFKRKKLTPDFELTLFPGNRHILRLNGFSSRRTGEIKLKNTVKFDADTYNAGDVIDSTLNINMVGLTYGYRLLKARRYDLAADVRVQIAQFETNVTGPTNSNRKADSIVLPLPMVGVEGHVEVFNKWNLAGRYQWLGTTIGTTHGVIGDWRLGLRWQYSQHLGMGLDYRTFNINVDAKGGSHPGAADLRYRGIQLGFRGSL